MAMRVNDGQDDPRECPAKGEVYRSDRGTGDLQARVLRVSERAVELELVGRKRNARFEVPLRFFCGRTCGWVREPRAGGA
jgi:hypothetical protein